MTTPAFTSREVILTDRFTAEGATITLGRHIEGSRPSGFGIWKDVSSGYKQSYPRYGKNLGIVWGIRH